MPKREEFVSRKERSDSTTRDAPTVDLQLKNIYITIYLSNTQKLGTC